MDHPEDLRIGVFSRGLARTLRAGPFLDYPVLVNPSVDDPRIAMTAGWGRKVSGERAAQYAALRGIPCVRLEDGFLRSIGLGSRGDPPLSIVVDDLGIYYDATRTSRLEHCLNHDEFSPDLLARAERLRSALLGNHLSKYNHAPDAQAGLIPDTGRPRVLLVDQTAGDASIRYGLASDGTFRQLLAAALAENPDAAVYIKTHPDVIAGQKASALAFALGQPGLNWIGTDVSPPSLLRQVDRVYTVTSQMGFEAMLLGKPVTCLGLPFYAGWGISDDRVNCPRRRRRRSVLEILAAAYLLYPRYVDPTTGQRCEPERVVEYLSANKGRGQRPDCRRWPILPTLGRWRRNR